MFQNLMTLSMSTQQLQGGSGLYQHKTIYVDSETSHYKVQISLYNYYAPASQGPVVQRVNKSLSGR